MLVMLRFKDDLPELVIDVKETSDAGALERVVLELLRVHGVTEEPTEMRVIPPGVICLEVHVDEEALLLEPLEMSDDLLQTQWDAWHPEEVAARDEGSGPALVVDVEENAAEADGL